MKLELGFRPPTCIYRTKVIFHASVVFISRSMLDINAKLGSHPVTLVTMHRKLVHAPPKDKTRRDRTMISLFGVLHPFARD